MTKSGGGRGKSRKIAMKSCLLKLRLRNEKLHAFTIYLYLN